MLFLFFALALIGIALYFKQLEGKLDYVLVALAIFPMFLQIIILTNEDFYKKLAFEKRTECVYNYLENSTLLLNSSCIETNILNTNKTAFTFSVLDYYTLRSFDMTVFHLSHIFLFASLIFALLYTGYKSLKVFNFIK